MYKADICQPYHLIRPTPVQGRNWTTGVTPTGAVLGPPMPWHDLAKMTDADIDAVVVYLRTLPPIRHKVN